MHTPPRVLALLALAGTLTVALATSPACAQAQDARAAAPKPQTPPHDAAFLEATPTKIATGFKFAEGPVWIAKPATVASNGHELLQPAPGEGLLLVCDLGASMICMLDPDDYKAASPGNDAILAQFQAYFNDADKPAGATLDSRGHLLVAHFSGKVERGGMSVETDLFVRSQPELPGIPAKPAPPWKADLIADSLEGVKLARCNDIIAIGGHVVLFTDFSGKEPGPNSPTGGLLATDTCRYPAVVEDLEPVISENDVGFGDGATEPLQPRPVTRLDANFVRANGLCFDEARKVLYVADMGANTIIAYDLSVTHSPTQVTLANRRIFADFADVKALGGAPDGMKLDASGNLFTTGPGGVWVLTPAGERIAHLPIAGCSNLCFGPLLAGADSRDLYITARDSVFRVRVKTAIAAPASK
jgi:sugar lactone lactonase YvrE